jgi:hypothetical protein
MASNQNRRRYRLSLFRLFHRSGPARLKYSGSSRRLKNKEQVKEAQTDEGPSCSHDQRKRKSWRVRVGEVGKLLVYPLKSLRKSFSGSSKRAQQSSTGYISGCHRGVLNLTRSGSCESHSDDSNPADFSYTYVKNLLENNNFCTN